MSGPANMGLDLELLGLAEDGQGPFLRLYTWDGPWISFGYFQKIERAVDAGWAEKVGVRVVKRPTGGKALLHAGDLTYAVAVPERHEVAGLGIVGAYEAISARVVAALRCVGVEAELGSRKPGSQERGERGTGPCAAEVMVESVMVGGKKLVGSAQVRRRGAVLQHGSVPVRDVREEWVRCLFPRGAEGRGWWEWYRARTTTLEAEGVAVGLDDMGAALVAAFEGF